MTDPKLVELETSADDAADMEIKGSLPDDGSSGSQLRELEKDVLDARDLQCWNKQYAETKVPQGQKLPIVSNSSYSMLTKVASSLPQLVLLLSGPGSAAEELR